jgi:hypothetical protein
MKWILVGTALVEKPASTVLYVREHDEHRLRQERERVAEEPWDSAADQRL